MRTMNGVVGMVENASGIVSFLSNSKTPYNKCTNDIKFDKEPIFYAQDVNYIFKGLDGTLNV